MSRVAARMLNPEIPLRRRLFQLLSTIALAEFVLVTAYTMVSGGALGHILLMMAGTGLFAGTVAWTFRSGKLRLGSTLSALLYFLIYPLTFFSSGGMYGGAPVVFAFAMVYVFLATEHWERIAAMGGCIAGSGVCFYLSYRRPELLDRHTVLAEHVESFLSILLVTLLLCTLFAFVTQVYRTENQIVQRQKRKIEELNQSQKRFFSSMSHEIRTPVNAILGLNEMNLRQPLSQEVRENAMNIDAAGQLLLHTINEIMDLSRLETCGLEIVPGAYRTADLLTDIASLIRVRAESKGLSFRIHVDPDLPSGLWGDQVRIKQILLNVTTNAVKYTREGSVTLSVAGVTGAEGQFSLVCTVADTGIGIRPESIPHLFTAFQRLDTRENHAIEGTGLGLFIVKQLLDRMEGSICVSSEYGKGSVFTIQLPQQVVDSAPIGELSPKKPTPARTAPRTPAFVDPKLRVLAVDDTPMNLMVLKKLLRDTQVQLDTAASGAQALALTAEHHYDVIFMDHQMPEMDGIQCLRAIRAQEGGQCRESRVVCLTANVGSESQALYRAEGFDGYLAKPVRGKTLEAELMRLCPGSDPQP